MHSPARLSVPVLLSAFVTTAIAEDEQQVLTENRGLEIAIKAPALQQPSSLTTVKYSYTLRNTSDKRQRILQHFPMHALMRMPKDSLRILVDGQPVEFDARRADQPANANRAAIARPSRAGLSPEENFAWAEKFESWLRQDAELAAMIDRFRELNAAQDALNPLTEQFEKAIRPHLIHKRDCEYAALLFASGRGTFTNRVRLMPEIEPAFREDVAFNGKQYVAFLSEYETASYRPYEKEWRARLEAWFQEKPQVAALLPDLRKNYRSFLDAEALLNGPILKRLHDHCGLSREHSRMLLAQIRSRRGLSLQVLPVVEHLFPKLRLQRSRESQGFASRLIRWGFDPVRMSPVTGMLHPAARTRRRAWFHLTEDPTIPPLLGQTPVSQSYGFGRVSHDLWQGIGIPYVCSFDVDIPASGKVTVTASYELPLQTLPHPHLSTILMGGRDELICVLPPDTRQSNIDVSVTAPIGMLPVLSPEPKQRPEPKNGQCTYQLKLAQPRQNVYLAVIDYRSPLTTGTWLHRFPPSEETLDVLRKLQKEITNPVIAPLLLAAECRVLFKLQKRSEARQLLSRLRRDYGDLSNAAHPLDFELQFEIEQALERSRWIAAKSRSPVFINEEDIRPFISRNTGEAQELHADEIALLAEAVRPLDETKLTVQEKIGRRFLLCQSGVDRKENLAAFVRLAEANPGVVLNSLKLIQVLPVEKAEVLPYVLKQIDPKLREKKVNSNHPLWLRQNAAYHALRSFESPEAVPGLIGLIRSTDDALLIQGALQSLKRMTLPELIDGLLSVSERVAGSSVGAFYDYLEVIIKADRDKALPRLKAIAAKHPRYTRRITSLRADLGDRSIVAGAIEDYNNSKSASAAAAAAYVLGRIGEPADLEKLNYRKNLEAETNEALLSVIRSKGGTPELFGFVEQYFLDHVRGRKEFQYLTVVRAFEEVGDRRALPYLREILDLTERKQDAAAAIGKLMLDRSVRRQRDDPDRQLQECLFDLDQRELNDEEREQAIQTLLQQPERTMQLAVKRGHLFGLLTDESGTVWRHQDEKRLTWLRLFGDVAARQLLAETRGRTLEARYTVAKLLGLLPPETSTLLQKTALDRSRDEDERRTAVLALGQRKDSDAIASLAKLLEGELLRGNVIDSLATIGTQEARTPLETLKAELEDVPEPTFPQRVWQAKIDKALRAIDENQAREK